MSLLQQGDVLLFNTVEGGEMDIQNGITRMSGGLETAFYLSLFGGNEEDPVTQDTINQWWGNGLETDSAFMYRSETQYLLSRLPPTSANLLLIEAAANRDVAWAKQKNVVTSVQVTATIPELNKLMLVVEANVEGEETRISFLANWKADI
jgi:phage gp46-like protein